LLAETPQVIGLNYWTSFGGSTRLWEESGDPRPAAATLTSFYSPSLVSVKVTNAVGEPLSQAVVIYLGRTYSADIRGQVHLPDLAGSHQAIVSAPGYFDHGLLIGDQDITFEVALTKTHENWLFKLHQLTYRILTVILRSIN
jgi:hypothetical protein